MFELTAWKKQNRNQELLFVLLYQFNQNNIVRIFVLLVVHVNGIVDQPATADNNSI